MNPLPSGLASGTLGELFVQLRLLELGLQAAPPLKDTGNDLAAFRGRVVRTNQVKTSLNGISKDNRLPANYDLLALVDLRSDESGSLILDESRDFINPR